MNVSDRVKIVKYIGDPPDRTRIGEIGVIVEIAGRGKYPITVEFEYDFIQPFCAEELELVAPTQIFVWEISSIPGVIMVAADSLHQARALLRKKESALIDSTIERKPDRILEDGCGVFMITE